MIRAALLGVCLLAARGQAQTVTATPIDCRTIHVTVKNTATLNEYYRIFHSTDGGTTATLLLTTDALLGGETLAFDDTGLIASTTYTYRVTIIPAPPRVFDATRP